MSHNAKSAMIVSHAFAPSSSSRAIRLAYLCQHLRQRGWNVSAFTVETPQGGGSAAESQALLEAVREIEIVRSSPGLLYRLGLRAVGRKQTGRGSRAASTKQSWDNPLRGWMARRLLEPSLEWTVTGLPGLLRSLDQQRPSVVLSSSLPYAAHLLCRNARLCGRRFRWIGDFGDPLIGGGGLQPVALWRSLWTRVEASVLRQMAHLTVTTKRTRELFLQHYPWLDPQRISVVRNGYDPQSFAQAQHAAAPESSPLVLAYVGSIYYPRVSIAPFVEAMKQLSASDDARWRNARIRIVGPVVGEVAALLQELPGAELAGQTSFERSLEEMATASILLLWGNQSGVQIPAKVFHYIGAGRPILCMVSSLADDLADLLSAYGRARVVLNQPSAIAAGLASLVEGLAASSAGAAPEEFTWSSQLARLEQIMLAQLEEAAC